jgi:IS30 family transposase
MDTVIGKARTKPNLLVLSERKTRYELIIKLPDKSSKSVVAALNQIERKYRKRFPEIFKTITCDNGCEFANWRGMEQSALRKAVRTKLYYCHPYSAYERGTNENTNRIIRRFCPKGTDFRRVPPGYIRAVETWINNYPREVLGFKSAAELFEAELHKLIIT